MIQHNERPQKETAANKLYSPRSQLICSFSTNPTFVGGNLPHDFLVPSMQGRYQICVLSCIQMHLPITHLPWLLHTPRMSPRLAIMAFPSSHLLPFPFSFQIFMSAFSFSNEFGSTCFWFTWINFTYIAPCLYSSFFLSCTFLFLQVLPRAYHSLWHPPPPYLHLSLGGLPGS